MTENTETTLTGYYSPSAQRERRLLERFHLKDLRKDWPHAQIWLHEKTPFIYLGSNPKDESWGTFFYDRRRDTIVKHPPTPGYFDDPQKPKGGLWVGPNQYGRIVHAPVETAMIQTRAGRDYVILDQEWCIHLAPCNETLKKYGITDIDYLTMLWHQDGCCAICKRPPKTRKLNIDHDHKKKGRDSVRGLLCYSCNYGLGVFKDKAENLANAAEYLRRPSPLIT